MASSLQAHEGSEQPKSNTFVIVAVDSGEFRSKQGKSRLKKNLLKKMFAVSLQFCKGVRTLNIG